MFYSLSRLECNNCHAVNLQQLQKFLPGGRQKRIFDEVIGRKLGKTYALIWHRLEIISIQEQGILRINRSATTKGQTGPTREAALTTGQKLSFLNLKCRSESPYPTFSLGLRPSFGAGTYGKNVTVILFLILWSNFRTKRFTSTYA